MDNHTLLTWGLGALGTAALALWNWWKHRPEQELTSFVEFMKASTVYREELKKDLEQSAKRLAEAHAEIERKDREIHNLHIRISKLTQP